LQLLTVSTAISFAIEAVNLRRQLSDQESAGRQPFEGDARASGDKAKGFYRQEPRPLPPPQATQFSSMWDDGRFTGSADNNFVDYSDNRG
jgi:hypothetical protein